MSIEFKANYVIPFTVTTGSGWSKGVYKDLINKQADIEIQWLQF